MTGMIFQTHSSSLICINSVCAAIRENCHKVGINMNSKCRIVAVIIGAIKSFKKEIEDYLLICYNTCAVQPTPENGKDSGHKDNK